MQKSILKVMGSSRNSFYRISKVLSRPASRVDIAAILPLLLATDRERSVSLGEVEIIVKFVTHGVCHLGRSLTMGFKFQSHKLESCILNVNAIHNAKSESD